MLPTEYRYRRVPLKITEEPRITPLRVLAGASAILGILFYPFEQKQAPSPPIQYNSLLSIDSLVDSTQRFIDSTYRSSELSHYHR